MRGWLIAVHQDQAKDRVAVTLPSIMTTNDGGETWAEQSLFRDEADLRDVSLWNAEKGIAVGERSQGINPSMLRCSP